MLVTILDSVSWVLVLVCSTGCTLSSVASLPVVGDSSDVHVLYVVVLEGSGVVMF